MALVFTEGFDAYGTSIAGNPLPTGALARRGWTNGSTPKVRAGRINGYSMSTGYNSNVGKTISGTETTKTVGFAFQLQIAAYNGDILYLYDGASVQMKVNLDPSGRIRVYRNFTLLDTSTERIPVLQWQYIEFKTTINNTTGAYELKLNGTTILSDSGIDTQNTANTYWDIFYLKGNGGWDGVYFDDVYVTDSTGSIHTGFMGTIHIETLFPNADEGTNDWTTSTGTDHYAMVDENPADDDTSYVEDNVSTNRELFDFPAISPTTATILSATSIMDMRVTDATSVDMNPVNDSNSTITVGTTQTISSQSQARYEEIYEENPDTSSAWTKTTIEAAKFGFEVD